MHDDPSAWATLAYRFTGAIAGAFLALVFILPRSWRDFWRRSTGSIVAGLVLAYPVRLWLDLPQEGEYVMASAAIAGFGGWGAMSVYAAIVRAKRDELGKG